MKSIGENIRSLFALSANIIPPSLCLNSSNRIIFPTYHTVSDKGVPHIENLYKVKTTKELIKDLDFILKYFEPIDLQTLIRVTLNHEKINRNYFHLTFDDGLRECYDVIMPILKKKGIPASFFLNPAFLDNKDLMHRYKASLLICNIKKEEGNKQKVKAFIKKKMGIKTESTSFILSLNFSQKNILDEIGDLIGTDFHDYLKIQKPYLDTSQIQEMIHEGFTIGAHSINHPEYMLLTEEEQLDQTIESINTIQRLFTLSYRVFAFPFTDHGIGKKFFNRIYETTQPKANLTFGVAGLKKDVFYNLQRIPMEKNISAKKIIQAEYMYYYLKAGIGKNVIRR